MSAADIEKGRRLERECIAAWLRHRARLFGLHVSEGATLSLYAERIERHDHADFCPLGCPGDPSIGCDHSY